MMVTRPTTKQMMQATVKKLQEKGEQKTEIGGWLDKDKEVKNSFFDLADKIGKTISGTPKGNTISIAVGDSVSGANNALEDVLDYLAKMRNSVDRAVSRKDTSYAKSLSIDLKKLGEIVKSASDKAYAKLEEDEDPVMSNYQNAVNRAASAISTLRELSDSLWDIQGGEDAVKDLRKSLGETNTAIGDAASSKNSLQSLINGNIDLSA